MDMVGTYQSTNKAWESLLSAVRSLLKRLHIGITWPKDKLRSICSKDSYCIGLGMLGRRRKFEVFTYHAVQVKMSKGT